MEKRQVAIFEAKYAKTLDDLEASCDAALQQIEDRQYAKDFADDYDDILCYGIAFYKKRCLVKKNNENHEKETRSDFGSERVFKYIILAEK